jgi:sulfate transport system permease protein
VSGARRAANRATQETFLVRLVLTTTVLAFFTIFILLPLIVVFSEALSEGVRTYFSALADPDARHAILLTLIVVSIVVPLNTVFGLAAAWAIARFDFRGRALLTSLIDLPLWVSPVISGLVYVLVFGKRGWLGPWCSDHNIVVIFALPGILLATLFVTFPFVARGLIPLMQAQGQAEEEAALTLGASGWKMFWRVTVPKIKWGLLYGVILCSARAMGDFGAVSVVSGHIRGKTNTMPLHIEILHNEFLMSAAFAMASLLSLMSMVLLVAKLFAEQQAERQIASARNH